MTDWATKAGALVPNPARCEADEYRATNADIIRKTVGGIGIDSGTVHADSGMRVVFNISSAHVRPALKSGYRNCYDMEAMSVAPIGSAPPARVSDRRRRIDQVVAGLSSPAADPASLYYGAIELNGAGMRYYGDKSLVLRNDQFAGDALLLYRNSYDLDRDPIRARVKSGIATLEAEAGALAGFRPDAADMILCKILGDAPPSSRLLTSGTISEGVLVDEDYIEVPRRGSFAAAELGEMRTSAGDVAVEARIADRLDRGPSPTLAELLWRSRRRDAERCAADHGIPVRVVGSQGRTR